MHRFRDKDKKRKKSILDNLNDNGKEDKWSKRKSYKNMR